MEIEILHAARGDKKKSINTETAAGKKELAALLDKLLKGGTAIFLERKKRTLRVKKYDPDTDTLTVEVEKGGENREVKTRAGKAKATAVAPVAGGVDAEYHVETTGTGCAHCKAGFQYAIVDSEGVEESTTWNDREDAESFAEALNDAFKRGYEKGKSGQ